MNKLVLFGAGKIGRSFIGQLFARSGYEVVFVDISEQLINELEKRHEYEVIIKSDMSDTSIKVENVRGILATKESCVAEEIADADIVAVSVGQNGLPDVISLLAKGLLLRRRLKGLLPLDIILAENMRNADNYVREKLRLIMGPGYPLEELVGLIETSIGKMVPIMPLEVKMKYPLLVYAEPYNTLILDKKAFRNPIPQVEGLAPKENMKAWVDRKSYIHNLGHAAAAYSGFLAEPDTVFIADVLKNKAVKKFVRSVMMQGAGVLLRKYPGEFTRTDLMDHVDDLIFRFGNRALGDTVYRVGCDLKRKLFRNDRILSPLIDGLEMNSPVDKILLTFAYGLCFRASDEKGDLLPGDAEFAKALNEKGLGYVLKEICGLDPESNFKVMQRILTATWNVIPIQLTIKQYFAPFAI